MATTVQWEVGLEVIVAPRTWPGINKPGGHGKIVKIHYSSLGVVDSLDVRYTLGKGIDTNLDTDLVKPHIELDRGRRSRRGRDFFATKFQAKKDAEKPHAKVNNNKAKEEKENDDPGKGAKTASKQESNKPKSRRSKNPSKKSKTTATTTSRPRDEAPSEHLPKKKKRDKSNGTLATNRKTPTTTADVASATSKKSKKNPVDENNDQVRDGVPEFVVTKASSLSVLSPLAVGKTNNVDTPFQVAPVSEEEPNNTNQAVAVAVAVASYEVESRELDTIGRKTLKNVFEDQMQEATCYIDSLVGGPQDKPSKPPLDEGRFKEFTRIYSAAMRQHDEIPEDGLFQAINELTRSMGCKPFTSEEMDPFVSELIAEDKVMLSGGYFYSI